MATFADFALLRTLPSYGGAEIVRAQRVHDDGEAPAVHLALYGAAKGGEVTRRLSTVAEAASQTVHEQVARIHEVGVHAGQLYATALPAEGLELSAVLEHERRRRGLPNLAFTLAAVQQLALLAAELQDRGDVWAAESGGGLAPLFPAGLRLDSLVIARDGKLLVRVLASAISDPARPTAFRAPEQRIEGTSVASDVFIVAQVLRALLSGDATATSAPRLGPPVAHLGKLLAAGLVQNPDERLGLFILVERLNEELMRAAGKTRAAGVIASYLKREYRALMPDEATEVPASNAAVVALRAQLPQVRASLAVHWPRRAGEPASPIPDLDNEVIATAVLPKAAADSSSAVGRVFDEGEGIDETDPRSPFRRQPRASSTLDLPLKTLADQSIDTDLRPRPTFEHTQESDPPWISMSGDFALLGTKREPSAAPLATPSEIEGSPTVETRAMGGAVALPPDAEIALRPATLSDADDDDDFDIDEEAEDERATRDIELVPPTVAARRPTSLERSDSGKNITRRPRK